MTLKSKEWVPSRSLNIRWKLLRIRSTTNHYYLEKCCIQHLPLGLKKTQTDLLDLLDHMSNSVTYESNDVALSQVVGIDWSECIDVVHTSHKYCKLSRLGCPDLKLNTAQNCICYVLLIRLNVHKSADYILPGYLATF